jgi:hypothetical protein
MIRRLLFLVFALALAVPVSAACDLQMSLNCQNGVCTSTTVNNGGSCSGSVYTGFFSFAPTTAVQISGLQTNLGGVEDCIESSELGDLVDYSFAFCYGETSVGSAFTSSVRVSGAFEETQLIAITFVADDEGEEIGSAYAMANVALPTCTPSVSAPPISQAGVEYTVSWTAVSDPTAQYIIEESTTADFSANVTDTLVNGLSRTYRHEASATTAYYYRVRATHCHNAPAGPSAATRTVVQATPPPSTKQAEIAVPFGSKTPVNLQVFIPGPRDGAPTTFTATTDKPYLRVTPSFGNLPPQGVTVTITADPSSLPPGASTGTLIVTTSSSTLSAAASSTVKIPISISLVTPVMPGGKSVPPANALIIPAVAHANGAAGPFLSDVRLTNTARAPITYQITMTPTQTNAKTSSKVTQVTVDASQTIALDDVVKNFFGYGATPNPADFGFGSLEIRPLNVSSTATYASSRTYASTAGGTFGQFVAAIPFTKFATQRSFDFPLPGGEAPAPAPVLSLQQLSESAKFRTNVGIVEGSGEPANGRIRIFNAAGQLLKEVPYSLMPGEHRQMNRFIADPNFGGIATLDDGRIEVTVDSPTGAVTAYASVLDNLTTDPLAVSPVAASQISATRYVVPGMVDLPNRANNFHSDMRVFNGGTTDMPVNMTFYPMGGGAPVSAQPRTIRAGEVLVVDNVLPSLFNVSENGGSVLITTAQSSSLVATGRTFTKIDGGGTFGQFIPGVTPAEGIGVGDRPLQVMQLEDSARFRSNVGLTELTGNGATVRVTLHLPDSKATPVVELTLAPNEFRQIRPIPALNPGQETYNARIEVEVISGSGRVTAYGSVIDNESKDPTYVPAQ